ncbi:MAG: activase [bacterium]|nr:activase [bacterium]
MEEALGICLGASTASVVRLRREGETCRVVLRRTQSHEGSPRDRIRALLGEVGDLDGLHVAVTGRKFRHLLRASTLSEPEALELAVRHVLPGGHPYRVVVSVGGETFIAYHLDDHGRIQGIHTGNKCASGTGEFFLQQLRRMGTGPAKVGGMTLPETIHKVSGRCSVFCKSDCTHALNKGTRKPEVVAGLARMMAGKVVELVRKLPEGPVMLVGGCANNRWMVHFLRQELEAVHIPEQAACFEALGAGLWALDRPTRPVTSVDEFFAPHGHTFAFLRPLSESRERVRFVHHERGSASPGDHTIVGLDVGSTTTKGVVMRRSDKAVLAAEYLRTNGDPVGASRDVYRSLAGQLTVPIHIEGLGVTGSGRQIAGLHGMTRGVINEIIAHATGALHFDAGVDTIFEIGGQDAKYTHITNGVASDYAMNEACSAGTGSFLEEAAKESLGIEVTEIGATAYEGSRPPNFNDQCAAFIGSDIKRAAQEGIPVADVVAGLVYSVCMNYANRVKANRPVGRKVFMQGGVCYNHAVPAAMAALTGKDIVVPPEPGLMGAFGVALEVHNRIDQDLLESDRFDLDALGRRELNYLESFTCDGCDRKCIVAQVEIDGQTYPFGGICNRFDNIIQGSTDTSKGANLAAYRERRTFRPPAVVRADETACVTVGFNRSFLMHTYYPFFASFFQRLGCRVVLPETMSQEGVEKQGAAFCYPAEMAHGYAADLLKMSPDFVFLPHVRGLPRDNTHATSCTCVFVQGEPYYLKTAFADLGPDRCLTPFLDLSEDFPTNRPAFIEVGRQLGATEATVDTAFREAWQTQERYFADLRKVGARAIRELERDPTKRGVVLFGRPYNAFSSDANKGIPDKLATRGVTVIPCDMLPLDAEELTGNHNMYWAQGRQILKAAQFTKRHPQLFGTYITNFSCGPDSFLLGYVRDIMGRKPSLTLELDNHTADAGIETRIEAFLDIVGHYRDRDERMEVSAADNGFRPAQVEPRSRRQGIRTSDGDWVPLDHHRVRVVVPAMGKYGTPLLAGAFLRRGIRAVALPPADEEVLKIGRGNSSCKECLPLQTTTGSLLACARDRPDREITVYFMASTDGPCRFGQYRVFTQRLIEARKIPNMAILSLTTTDGYGGLGNRFAMAAWRAIVIGDLFDEMWSTILAAAEDRDHALAVLDAEHQALLRVMGRGWPSVARQLSRSARRLSTIRLKRPYDEIPKLSLVGEIYVRRDPLSLQGLIERLGDLGFIVRTSQTGEWLKYLNWLTRHGIESPAATFGFRKREWVQNYLDRAVHHRLAPCGLFYREEAQVEPTMDAGSRFVSPRLTGEAILTVGSAFHEILRPSCGVIAIGPFGCMPTRVAEAILNETFTTGELRSMNGHVGDALKPILNEDRRFPFLAIETDGNAFPQLIEARLEAFCLQASRLHARLIDREVALSG